MNPSSTLSVRQLLSRPSEELRKELDRRKATFRNLYPDTGPYRRELYSKHMEFFEASLSHTESACLGANRSGKTLMGAFAMTAHLTGLYPTWWPGKKFAKPISAWAAGDTSKTVRDIMQEKLIGSVTAPGTGMIPKDLVINTTNKAGVPDALESIFVRHASGGVSTLNLKSFDQKRISFQGTSQHVIWLDEEVDEDIYTECVMRTMKTSTFEGGIVYLTFTPLMGLSKVVQLFVPDGQNISEDRFALFISWDDVPHLDDAEKAERAKKIPEFQRDARTKGIPQLGSGAIYPIPDSELLVDPFPIPKHWRKCYGLDVGGGFNEGSTGGTACLWGAINPENGQCFLYDEYFRSGAEPSIHAAAIKARGAWIKGVVDPAARGRSQVDGQQLLQMYRELGLDIAPARNAVEAGIYEVWDAMSTGMLKVFSTLQKFRAERNLYRRDIKGRIVKERDHLMDCCKYLQVSGRDRALPTPIAKSTPINSGSMSRGGSMGWVR